MTFAQLVEHLVFREMTIHGSMKYFINNFILTRNLFPEIILEANILCQSSSCVHNLCQVTSPVLIVFCFSYATDDRCTNKEEQNRICQ